MNNINHKNDKEKEIRMNNNKIVAHIMCAVQIFFGVLFWIYLISTIVNYQSTFVAHARPLAISILMFVILVYTVMKFDENKKSAHAVALLSMVFALIGFGCFLYYTYKISKELPVRSYIPAILCILIYTIAKELKKEYSKKAK